MERSWVSIVLMCEVPAWHRHARLPEAANWNEGMRTTLTALGSLSLNTLGTLPGVLWLFLSYPLALYTHTHTEHHHFPLSRLSVSPCCVSSHLNILPGFTPALPTDVFSKMKQPQVKSPDSLIGTHTPPRTHTCMHMDTHAQMQLHISHYWLLNEIYPWASLLSIRL